MRGSTSRQLATLAILLRLDLATCWMGGACGIGRACRRLSCSPRLRRAGLYVPNIQQDLRHWSARRSICSPSIILLMAKPNQGSIVDSYQTVSVNCSKCRSRLFRYKKKNGTKSQLVKCYVERISEDSAGLLESMGMRLDVHASASGENSIGNESQEWFCPKCNQRFARSSLIHGRPALKMAGGKVRMTKK